MGCWMLSILECHNGMRGPGGCWVGCTMACVGLCPPWQVSMLLQFQVCQCVNDLDYNVSSFPYPTIDYPKTS